MANLKSLELEEVFKALMYPNRVTEISINSSDLSVISENVLATALSRIKSVKLYSTSLTCRQLTDLFSQIRKFSLMKDLVLSRHTVSSVPADELAKSLVKLRSIEMEYSYLTIEQVTQLLRAALEESSCLENVKFGTFGCSWSDVHDENYSLPASVEQLVFHLKEIKKMNIELFPV